MELKEVRRISFEKGLGQKFICKENRLTQLLTQLYLLFKEEMILKGGTALNRAFLGDEGRFSEDIDIDIINQKKTIGYLTDKMKQIEGFDVKKPRLMNKTLRFDCYYVSELGEKDRIQVEFYLGHTTLIGETKLLGVRSPILTEQTTIVHTYSFESLIARKIVALINREEGKDLYDLFFSLKKEYNSRKLSLVLKELCVYYGIADISGGLERRFDTLVKNISYIANSTNHYVVKDNRLGWSFIAEDTKRMIVNQKVYK